MSGVTTDQVCVVVLACGPARYIRSALESVESVLARTEFQVCLVTDARLRAFKTWERSGRFHHLELSLNHLQSQRAKPFLGKFAALTQAMNHCDAPVYMMLDADAVVTTDLTHAQVREALGHRGLAMVEQTTIAGSDMTRRDFLDHYRRYTSRWFGAPRESMPALDTFRFYNAGVVLGTREALSDLSDWALTELAWRKEVHEVGDHMIADQDYVQFWCNHMHPEVCGTLPWYWNHCEHWDEGFPREGAFIAHFSNFCHGPTIWQRRRIRILRKHGHLGGLEARMWNWVARVRRG